MSPARVAARVVVLLALACGAGACGVTYSNAAGPVLFSLTLSSGTLAPHFHPNRTVYTVGPAVLASSVTVTPIAEVSTATITVNGMPTASGAASPPIALALGITQVTVLVSVAGDTRTTTYTLAIDRTSADLAQLTASAGELAPDFDAATSAYVAGGALLPGATTITATTADPGATLEVDGVAAASGVPSAPVALPLGLTTAVVKATARDGTTRTTTVALDRGLPGQQAYVKASNTGADDNFGQAVAVSGDTLVVGAPSEDGDAVGVNGVQTNDGRVDSGAVYVFVRVAGVWTQQAYLKASNPDPADFFGASVAISGDTLVVGAPREDSLATGVGGDETSNASVDSGAAYVFVRSGTSWAQQAYLKSSVVNGDARFGRRVAVSGDTAVVSTTAAGPLTGAVVVFSRSGTAWSHQGTFQGLNTEPADQFGESVDISGDTIVVGAPFEESSATGVNGDGADNGAIEAGAAYVFTRTGGLWSQQAYLKASNTGEFDQFGVSVAISGDTIVVGAYLEASLATGVNGDQLTDALAGGSGAAYVFKRTGGAWSQQAYLKSSNNPGTERFGWRVAISADTIAVGAPQEGGSSTGVGGDQVTQLAGQSGAVYVFARTGAAWAQQAYVKASNAEAGDQFGDHLALEGGTLAVGSIFEASNALGVNGDASNNLALSSGAVYVLR